MKFMAVAAATVVASLAGTTEATRLSGKYTSDVRFTSKLMENAKPYDTARELNYANAEITGAHSIIFKSCESLSVEADFTNDGDDDGAQTLYKLYEQGFVRAQKSYILFDVCVSANCDSGNASDRTTYITDMASFINAFVDFIPTKQSEYCTGCQSNANYCLYGSYNQNNNGGRHLESTLYEYIDCSRCKAYGCYTGYSNVDYSLNWIQTMTQCQQSQNPTYYNGLEVTTGFMCNQDGTGVEVAAFLDQDCTLYTNQVAYGNMMSEEDYVYYINSRQHIEYMFTTDFSCYDPTVVYINPADEASGNYNFDTSQQQYGDDAVPAAATWCQLVFQANIDVVDLDTCGGADATYDASNGGYTQASSLAEGDVQNGYAVCAALVGHGGEGDHVYDKKNSGSMYKYNGNKQNSANWGKQRRRSRALTAFLIIGAMGTAVAGAAYYIKKKKQKAESSASTTGNKEPLVAQKEGQMA